jgi:prenylcysteine oxidase/farnesylcysteine lyase
VYLEPYLKNFITRRWWAIRLWFLYGKSPGSAENLVSSTFSALDRLYSPAFFPFQSISAALRNVGLEEEVTSSADTYLSSKNVDGRFQREIFTPWVRLRHAQNLGTVSALGACMAAADVKPAFTVAGGLQHGLWESMAKRSMAETHLSTRVLGMRKGGWGGWMLATTPSEVSGEYQTDYKPFDAVILATSWVSADLHIQEQPLKNVPQNITYAGIHVTLFTSPYWIAMRDAPASVLTTVRSNEFSNANPHTGEAGQGSVGFWSLHMVREITTESRGREYVYKFISSTPLDDEMIKSWVYGAVTWVHREHLPNVYPLNFPNDLAHTQENEIYVDDGLWYTGAMERFMTGTEMSTLAGMNAARLLVNQWLSEGLHLKEERMIPEWLKNGTAPEPFYTKGKVPTPDSFVDESLTHSPHNPSGKGSRTPEI